jgi:hypothetical protein
MAVTMYLGELCHVRDRVMVSEWFCLHACTYVLWCVLLVCVAVVCGAVYSGAMLGVTCSRYSVKYVLIVLVKGVL